MKCTHSAWFLLRKIIFYLESWFFCTHFHVIRAYFPLSIVSKKLVVSPIFWQILYIIIVSKFIEFHHIIYFDWHKLKIVFCCKQKEIQFNIFLSIIKINMFNCWVPGCAREILRHKSVLGRRSAGLLN